MTNLEKLLDKYKRGYSLEKLLIKYNVSLNEVKNEVPNKLPTRKEKFKIARNILVEENERDEIMEAYLDYLAISSSPEELCLLMAVRFNIGKELMFELLMDIFGKENMKREGNKEAKTIFNYDYLIEDLHCTLLTKYNWFDINIVRHDEANHITKFEISDPKRIFVYDPLKQYSEQNGDIVFTNRVEFEEYISTQPFIRKPLDEEKEKILAQLHSNAYFFRRWNKDKEYEILKNQICPTNNDPLMIWQMKPADKMTYLIKLLKLHKLKASIMPHYSCTTKIRYCDPFLVKTQSDTVSKHVQRPDIKKKASERTRQMMKQPGMVERISRSTTRSMSSPEVRSKMMAGISDTNSTLEASVNRSEGMRKATKHYDWNEINRKSRLTKLKNGSYGKSKQEDELYDMLCEKFGNEDVLRQYNTEKYPFNCDFYIKSKELFIEYNGSQYHMGRPFDPKNPNDIKELHEIRNKQDYYFSKTSHRKLKNQYYGIEKIWTESDPLKRKTAKENNLNFLEFYTLKEAETWINSQK